MCLALLALSLALILSPARSPAGAPVSRLATAAARALPPPGAEEVRRLLRSAALAECLLRQSRIERYGTTPFMRYFLTHFQHRMVWPDVPAELLAGDGATTPDWYGKPGSFVPPAPVHYEMSAALDAALGHYGASRTLVEVWRGVGKSTLLDEAGTIRAVIRGRKNILLICATADEASQRLQSITHELVTNEGLLAEFPELARGKDDKGQWISYTDNQIVFANGARIRAYQFRAKLRGSLWNGARPDFVLLSDVENDDMQESESEMRKAVRWVNRTLIPALAPHCALFWVGTPLSPQCLMYRVRDEKGWTGPRQPAHNADGTPHWPEFWPEGRIQFVRHDMNDEVAFQQEIELNPLPDELAIFRPAHFDDHGYDARLLSGLGTRRIEYNGQPLSVYSWWDSAISKRDKAARTAVVTVGALPFNGVKQRLLVLDVRYGRWADDEQMEQLREVNSRYHPAEIGAQQTMLEKAIGPAAQRVYGVPFVAYQQNNSADAKHARIKSLQPLCAQGMLLFDHASAAQAGKKDGLRVEMVNYGFHPTNDILDALEGAVKRALENASSQAPPELCGVRGGPEEDW